MNLYELKKLKQLIESNIQKVILENDEDSVETLIADFQDAMEKLSDKPRPTYSELKQIKSDFLNKYKSSNPSTEEMSYFKNELDNAIEWLFVIGSSPHTGRRVRLHKSEIEPEPTPQKKSTAPVEKINAKINQAEKLWHENLDLLPDMYLKPQDLGRKKIKASGVQNLLTVVGLLYASSGYFSSKGPARNMRNLKILLKDEKTNRLYLARWAKLDDEYSSGVSVLPLRIR